MREADSYQVSGNHYRTSYQHWTFVQRCGLGYLDGCASKYITRWRKTVKPVSDLEKAGHYVAKMLENVPAVFPPNRRPQRFLRQELARFVDANQLEGDDVAIMTALVTWETEAELQLARELIGAQLAQIVVDEGIQEAEIHEAKPVPLTDSNKHAERA